jgi:hypothetical protein
MAKISRLAGSTGHVLTVRILDASSSTGAGLTGLTYNASGLACYYKRNRGAAAVAVNLANITTLGTYVSGGFKEIDPVHMPGFYEFHPPDASLASGAGSVAILLSGAAGMVDCPLEVELTGVDNQDGMRGGLGALPNASAAANGGLPVLSGSATKIDYDLGGKILGGGSGVVSGSAIGARVDVGSVGGVSARIGDGTATAVDGTHITLDAADIRKGVSNVGSGIRLLSGTQKGRTGIVTASNTSTGQQTIGAGWAGGVTPTGTPDYEFEDTASVDSSSVANAVLTALPSATIGSVAALKGVNLTGGTVSASPTPTTTVFTATGANLNSHVAGYLSYPMAVFWNEGPMAGQKFAIRAVVVAGSNYTFTVDAMPLAPAAGNAFVIG